MRRSTRTHNTAPGVPTSAPPAVTLTAAPATWTPTPELTAALARLLRTLARQEQGQPDRPAGVVE
jgi:hypothetical protein